MNDSKNNTAWEKIFLKHELLKRISDYGFAEISSKEINNFREARLMTKFDHKSQLPQIFSHNNLSILPISRGGYTIGNFKTFHQFDSDESINVPITFPTFLESLDYKNITSESTAINCAFVSNILKDFTSEISLFPTVSGRMSSSSFDFLIDTAKGNHKIIVENSQIEIDGGFEGDYSLNLIEAKNYISDDFLIRQLFYPYKLWSNKISKKVRPIFLSYTNGIFHLREYEFQDNNLYNSIKLVNYKKYIIEDTGFNTEVLNEIIDRTIILKEPNDTPFPQANSFERVINLCELLNQKGFISKEEITQNYDFDSRQTDYYSNAAKYLGLVEIKRDVATGLIGCFLTKKGKSIFNLSLTERQKEFVKMIVSQSVFNKTLKRALENGEIPKKEEIVEIMKSSNLNKVDSPKTFIRRSSTIIGWINWIFSQIDE
ncbi:MAG: transcriptional regulator [Spirosomataceae bacterium]|jgi:hypothetical protein